MKGIRFFLKAVAAKGDPEKLVLPGIIWIHKKDTHERGTAHVYWIGIGWWHFAITFAVGLNLKTHK